MKCQGACSWERTALAGGKGPASSGKRGLEKSGVEPHVWFASGGADLKTRSPPALGLSPAGYTCVCPSDLSGNPSENKDWVPGSLVCQPPGVPRMFIKEYVVVECLRLLKCHNTDGEALV